MWSMLSMVFRTLVIMFFFIGVTIMRILRSMLFCGALSMEYVLMLFIVL